MASALFDAYNQNLRRVYFAEFIDDHLQSQDPWRRRASPNGTLFSEKVRAEIRSKLLFSGVCTAPS